MARCFIKSTSERETKVSIFSKLFRKGFPLHFRAAHQERTSPGWKVGSLGDLKRCLHDTRYRLILPLTAESNPAFTEVSSVTVGITVTPGYLHTWLRLSFSELLALMPVPETLRILCSSLFGGPLGQEPRLLLSLNFHAV